ncbi:type III pantothenate kinase [Kyrpidia spormannii]|uniref:Type III pantothenate kinase n=3 Tax=Kyrpidia TaxID=1129704 RepID=A0A2K8N5A3_9BACL|nr:MULTISPECIES: type III pantothenate kinase [Kyrpidia]HHY66303.1 type III pantothenate kinase [Alicyclobacillus sp.]ADG04879.1 transcriptional activator, Baf family [Kyrpidia tusciae DSM 2912]ATY83652.1 type III pantothenate kinase [Kyrpidia spormannii]MCL6576396.1 type III pantothenate kinase [Kyrpidia sp.]CAB3389281.1 pantothenate kinase type III [Kyrpidia spormannii]
MLLTMDVGNTNIVLGVYKGRDLLYHWRMATAREKTEDELGMMIKSLFADQGVSVSDIDGVVISSVVPPLMLALDRMSKKYFHKKPLIIGPGIRTGLPIKIENPKEVGADRIVNCVGAIELYGPPLVIVDFGTATTFDVVNERGEYLGGPIAPGIAISVEALFQRAAKLPRIELVKPDHVLGRNTIDMMQSGVIYGFVGQVDGLVTRIRRELGLPFRVIATGGLAELISSESETIEEVNPYLTLHGLRIIWERNR